ncbi:MAG TPA: hypothetical protein VGM67_16465 [Gemmatimonadaceae bacterium]
MTFFDDGPDFIKIQFGATDDVVYVYDHVIPGATDVARMKALAVAGRGLSTYISQHVRDRYRRKETRDTSD